jgi:hypothetical protein
VRLYCFVYENSYCAGWKVRPKWLSSQARRQANIYRTMSSNIIPTDFPIHQNYFILQFRCSATRTQGHG